MPASRYIFGHLPWYSVLILTGVVAAMLLCRSQQRRRGLPQDTAIDLTLLVLPLGILGARLYYVIFSWENYASDLLSILRVWEGGLAIYGGVIGGVLAVLLYSRIKKLPLGTLLDCVAPGLALAQSIGRWGNFFNMEAYGLPITNPALQWFPLAVLIPDSGWHMATFFYESMWDLTVFLLLWCGRRKHRRDGNGMLWYLLLYGSGRLMIEGLRMDSLMSFTGGVRVSQLLSVLLVLAAACLLTGQGYRRLTVPARCAAAAPLLCAMTLGVLMLTTGAPILTRTLLGAGIGCCGALGVLISRVQSSKITGGE